jgi:Ca2+-transporting ATPase
VFSLDILDDRRFLLFGGLSLAAIVLAGELGVLQRLLHTVSLGLGQWLVCIAASLSVIVVTEVRKAFLRRRGATSGPMSAA